MSPKTIFHSTAIISTCTGISRILGLVREQLMAYFFGDTLAKSAFDVAFTIPNLFRQLFGEGALAASFIPIFTETLDKDGREQAQALAARVMTMLATTLTTIVLGGILLIALSIRYMTLGIKAAAVLPLLQIMMPYLLFICLVALCMAILNSFHHFTMPAMTPVILNLTWIMSLIFLCPFFGDSPDTRIYGVAWGILLAGVIQLLVQIPVLKRFGLNIRPTWEWRDPRVRRLLLLMGPATLGMGVHQVNVMLDKFLAFWAAEWAPAALTYAERLIYLPLGVFATALGTVLLPTFSRQAARADEGYQDLKNTFSLSLRILMLIMIPASIGLLVLAMPITHLVFAFKGGYFGEEASLRTARALMFYAPGLAVFSLYKVVVPVFYARQDTQTPIRVGILAVALNLILNIIFVLTWPADYKHSGLACATVLASAFNGGVLCALIHRKIGPVEWKPIGSAILKITLAGLIMGLAVDRAYDFFSSALVPRLEKAKIVQLVSVTSAILTGVMVYLFLAVFLCREEVRAFIRQAQKRRA